MLDDLRWLSRQPSAAGTLQPLICGHDVAVLDRTGDLVHLPDGCRVAVRLPGGRTGVPSMPDRRYRRVPLGRLLDGAVPACRDCLEQHLTGLHNRYPGVSPHWHLLKQTVRHARDVRRLAAHLQAPLGGFADVPWDATRLRFDGPPRLVGQVNRQVGRLSRQATRRIAKLRPGWLHVRYAAEVPGRLPALLRTRLADGWDLARLTTPDRRHVDRLVAAAGRAVTAGSFRPVLYRDTTTDGPRHRHLTEPVDRVDTPDGTVLVLSVPAPFAPHVGAGQGRWRCDWIDVDDGWQDDPSVHVRLRTAATLWSTTVSGPYRRAGDAYAAAAHLSA